MQLLCRQYASYAVSLIKGDNNCNPSLCKYTMHLLVNTCGIRAASAINAQRIISAKDGGDIKQQRCFLVYKKLDVKRLYTDVHPFNITARPD